jgi:hypothetical protein
VAVAVVLIALIFWVALFTVFFTARGITPAEFLFGRYEPLPADLGRWKKVGIDETGLLREERLVLPSGAGYLLHQVRYRHAKTHAIMRVEPERRIPRRRVGAR